MAKDMTTYPVMKNGKYIGRADAGQIAMHKSLKLFDPLEAEKMDAEAAIASEAKADVATEVTIEKAKEAGGAVASAVKKGPAK